MRCTPSPKVIKRVKLLSSLGVTSVLLIKICLLHAPILPNAHMETVLITLEGLQRSIRFCTIPSELDDNVILRRREQVPISTMCDDDLHYHWHPISIPVSGLDLEDTRIDPLGLDWSKCLNFHVWLGYFNVSHNLFDAWDESVIYELMI